MNTILDALNWRYATKQFDPQKKLTQEQVDVLLEALRLTASSFGLQPWKFIVVTNPDIREKLKAAAWGQAQVSDASHLIVFAVDTTLTDASVDEYVARIVEVRGVDNESLSGFSEMLKGFLRGKDPQQRTQWATKQAYIALGTLLTTAAIEHVDATGMEGFDAKQFDEILGLTEKGLHAVVIAPVGFRLAGDVYAQLKKVRYPIERVVDWIK